MRDKEDKFSGKRSEGMKTKEKSSDSKRNISRMAFAVIAISLAITMITLTSCDKNSKVNVVADYKNWESVLEDARSSEVTILMWGGNESINRYMDEFVSGHLKDEFDITLRRVPMVPPDYLTKLINEKKSGAKNGTADLLWINAENFLTAKEADLLDGPFTTILPNFNKYYDLQSDDVLYDAGIPIEGYEAIWGRAQLVFTYDSAVLENPPMNYNELFNWAKENPGKFTFPKIPDDFVGTAFFRNSFYELAGQEGKFSDELTRDEFFEISEIVVEYFNEIKPFLWNQGQSFPATQAMQDDLFKNGEVYITLGFEVGKTQGLIADKVYPDTVRSYVFDTGTIGNSHYLAIPFNSPNPAGALTVINFLQSPLAQIEKMKPQIWGDMPAFDVTKLEGDIKNIFDSLENTPGVIPFKTLTDLRLPEMNAQQVKWSKEIWQELIEKK